MPPRNEFIINNIGDAVEKNFVKLKRELRYTMSIIIVASTLDDANVRAKKLNRVLVIPEEDCIQSWIEFACALPRVAFWDYHIPKDHPLRNFAPIYNNL